MFLTNRRHCQAKKWCIFLLWGLPQWTEGLRQVVWPFPWPQLTDLGITIWFRLLQPASCWGLLTSIRAPEMEVVVVMVAGSLVTWRQCVKRSGQELLLLQPGAAWVSAGSWTNWVWQAMGLGREEGLDMNWLLKEECWYQLQVWMVLFDDADWSSKIIGLDKTALVRTILWPFWMKLSLPVAESWDDDKLVYNWFWGFLK